MRGCIVLLLMLSIPVWAAPPESADPASDAPEARTAPRHAVKEASSYAEALRVWQDVEDINAWIGERFQYDTARAVQLSETQRLRSGPIAIHAPEQFFLRPAGVCVDLARFMVETLRVIDPERKPRYLMLEFDPVMLRGNTLRRHWVVAYEHDGRYYVSGDSKRPGHVAGPYANAEEFVAEYARYRGRAIVSYSERDSYQRTMRQQAVRRERSERPAE